MELMRMSIRVLGVLCALQLGDYVAALDVAVVSDLPVKEDGEAAVRRGMYVPVSVHCHCMRGDPPDVYGAKLR